MKLKELQRQQLGGFPGSRRIMCSYILTSSRPEIESFGSSWFSAAESLISASALFSSSCARVAGGGVGSTIHSPSAIFLFYEWKSARAPIPLVGPGSVQVAQRAETTVTKGSLTSCVRACFPDRFPHYGWKA